MRRPFVIPSVVMLAILAVLWALGSFGPPATQEESLRIGTFNTAFILPSSAIEDRLRANRIADRILAGSYDVIALNEVFSGAARKVFVTRLSSTYLHFVSKLDSLSPLIQDSGLMLFSAFPFEPLPRDKHKVASFNVTARNGSIREWKDVAFIQYGTSTHWDWFAAKGAAFVRIKNPHTHRIYNVVFTHMQASYPQDISIPSWMRPTLTRAIRGLQLKDIQTLIEDSLLPHQLAREAIFVIGDLNIDGDMADDDLGPTECCGPNLFEWTEQFNTAPHFFTSVLQDTWAFEQSPFDRGLTNEHHWRDVAPIEDEGARLDYIVRNKPADGGAQSLCVQHLTLAKDLRDRLPFGEGEVGTDAVGGFPLSDHIGIKADVNVFAEFCSPVEARVDPLQDVLLEGQITHPGSMQWFRFDAAGTYRFALFGDGVEYRVYESVDLTTPVEPYSETETISVENKPIPAVKYHLPDVPFFVRVFHPNRTATGTYEFVAHRNDCTSLAEACVIGANDPIVHSLPPGPASADATSWFELRTEEADSGKSQNLRFIVDKFPTDLDRLPFWLELRREGMDTPIDVARRLDADGRQLIIARGDLDPTPTTMYMLVERKVLAATSFRVRWETNLSVLHGDQVWVPGAGSLSLFCVKPTDDFFGLGGSDELYLWVNVDSEETSTVREFFIGKYGSGTENSLEDVIPRTIKFLERVNIRLKDVDGFARGGSDYLSAIIETLPVDQKENLNARLAIKGDGGRYLFKFNLSRSVSRRP